MALPPGCLLPGLPESERPQRAARRQVAHWLTALEPALREGCVGQLPEIYDGENPTASRGCFAQAWSVGELLRVYEALERSVPDFFDHK